MQKATAPKNWVEFRQGSIGAISSSLATSYVLRRLATSLFFWTYKATYWCRFAAEKEKKLK